MRRNNCDEVPIGCIVFDKVTKTFAGLKPLHAVWDFSLSINPNESVGIIGPNGSGKSTLLKLAAGVTAPSSGQIRRAGRVCSVIELGAGIHPDLTGRENLYVLASLTGMSAPFLKRQLNQIVEFSGVGHELDRPIRHFSTGMVARLAFSVAVHSRSDVLLIDEVLSVGDFEFQQQCRARIFELRGEGTTVVLVSHDLELVGSACDRVVILTGGQVEFDGSADLAVRRYLGLPQGRPLDDDLQLALESSVVSAGEPFQLKLVLPRNEQAVRIRLDMEIPNHPTGIAPGDTIAVIFGSTVLPYQSFGPTRIAIATRDLPPVHFRLRCTVETADGVRLFSQAVPATVMGPLGRCAIQLRSQTSLKSELNQGQSV